MIPLLSQIVLNSSIDLLKEKICPQVIDKHDKLSNMILVT